MKGPHGHLAKQSWYTQRPGKDVTLTETDQVSTMARTEISKTIQPALDRFQDLMASKDVEVKVKARPKDPESLLTKMRGKWSDRTLSSVTDAVGSRVIFKNLEGLEQGRTQLASSLGMEVLEDEDFLEEGKPGGYRGEHLLMRSPNGVVFEVQLRTEIQNTFAEYAHEIYKKNLRFYGISDYEAQQAREYSEALGSWIHAYEQGGDPGSRPQAPSWVAEKGIEFPWEKIAG